MKFYITRVSNYGTKGKQPPISEAKIEHKHDNGYIEWSVEINSLEDLMELVQREGDIIVNKEKLTIYDDYIE